MPIFSSFLKKPIHLIMVLVGFLLTAGVLLWTLGRVRMMHNLEMLGTVMVAGGLLISFLPLMGLMIYQIFSWFKTPTRGQN